MKHPPVQAGEIDDARLRIAERLHRLQHIGRHVEIARQQIDGAERQHAQRLAAMRQRPRRATDRAIAAADHDGGIIAGGGALDLLDHVARLRAA